MTPNQKHILLVEDDLIDQMAFSRMMKQHQVKYPCTVVNTVNEAKEILKKESFQLVISDFNLPDGTTLDLLDDLNEIPLIIITGNEDDSKINNAKNNIGAIATFTKDLNLEYLNKISSFIDQVLIGKNSDSKEIDLFLKNELITDNENSKLKIARLFQMFDGNDEMVKDTIKIFIEQKKAELEEMEKMIFVHQNWNGVKKIAHKMQSGFRLFGMKSPEMEACNIEKITCDTNEVNCINLLKKHFNLLNLETKHVIDILQEELKILQ